MKRLTVCLLFVVVLVIPYGSQAASIAVGWGVTSFQGDLNTVDSGSGVSLEAVFGSGTVGLLLASLWSSHDNNIDYRSFMAGPVWSVGSARIYAGISNHDIDNAGGVNDGWGVSAGGGAGWKLAPLSSLLFDVRVSNWEGDNNTDVRTGTLQLMFQLGF